MMNYEDITKLVFLLIVAHFLKLTRKNTSPIRPNKSAYDINRSPIDNRIKQDIAKIKSVRSQ